MAALVRTLCAGSSAPRLPGSGDRCRADSRWHNGRGGASRGRLPGIPHSSHPDRARRPSKAPRLHGTAQALTELAERGDAATDSARWLLEHLLGGRDDGSHDTFGKTPDARGAVRDPSRPRRVRLHRLASRLSSWSNNWSISPLPRQHTTWWWPRTGKTQGLAGITGHGKRVRFYSTVGSHGSARGGGRGSDARPYRKSSSWCCSQTAPPPT